MSMTREEAIKVLNNFPIDFRNSGGFEAMEALKIAILALRPVSREQVEKVWKGEWIVQQDEHKEYIKKCSKCGFPISGWWGADKFCANCGTPMTDEAVQMVMERMEALHDNRT